MKIKMSGMKNILVRINGKSGIAEEKISLLGDIAIKPIQKDTEREKIILEKMNRASVSYGKTSCSLIYI